MGARGRASPFLPAHRGGHVLAGSEREAHLPPGATHPVLVGASEIFGAGTPNDTRHLRPTKHKLVDVFVSKNQLERALEFLDVLFQALESRGHRVDLAPAGGGCHHAVGLP